MKFSEYLKVMNSFFGMEKSQYDFMFEFFSVFLSEPFSPEDQKRDDDDNYYPFSSLCGESIAKKVYQGTRCLPKSAARFIHGHFTKEKFINILSNWDDTMLNNLASDLKKYGILCHTDNVADVAADTFSDFLAAAIDENDTIDTAISAKTKIMVQSDIATLLIIEAGNKCPLCGDSLTRKSKKTGSLAKYHITQIFPENVDIDRYVKFGKQQKINGNYNSYENLIALCSECSAEYLSDPTDEEFKNLLNIKKALQQSDKLKQDLTDMNLETEIQEIINGLAEISDTKKLVELKMDALRIDQKIEKKNTLLFDTVTNDVMRYYNYIEELFAEIDEEKTGTFKLIATEIQQAYLKISQQTNSQEQVFKLVEDWLCQRISQEHKNSMATRIVVSFFVQNCEVFDEISE